MDINESAIQDSAEQCDFVEKQVIQCKPAVWCRYPYP